MTAIPDTEAGEPEPPALPTPNPRPKRLRALLPALLVALIGIGIYALLPHDLLLLERSTKIVSTASWWHPKPFMTSQRADDEYQWLSDTKMLYFADVPEESAAYTQDSYGNSVSVPLASGGGKIYVYDTVTRQSSLLAKVNDQFNASWGDPISLEASANGKYIWWRGGKLESTSGIGMLFDCTHQVSRGESENRFEDYWLNENERLTIIIIGGDDDSIPDFKAAISDGISLKRKRTLKVTDGWKLGDSHIVQHDRIFHYQWDDTPNQFHSYFEIRESGIGGDKIAPLHTYKIKLPFVAKLDSIAIAPQGDKVAWLLTYDRPEPMTELLHKIVHSVTVRTRHSQSVWVSRIDGSEMHEVGHLYPRNDKDVVDGVKWMPNGKKLSFTYQDALWTVPAE